MQNINFSRVIMLTLAGAVAGLMIFAIFNPLVVQQENAGGMTELTKDAVLDLFVNAILLGLSVAAMLGGILLVADELASPPKRIILKMMTAVGVGAFIGGVAGAIGQLIFGIMVVGGGLVGLVIGRTIGWAIIGAGGGAGIGFALGSWKRASMCLLGGFVGGGVGGFLFDMLSFATGGGSVSRFVGFTLMCAATGAAVALVEDIAKQNWITILTGSREGKSYILTKPTTLIGRDELVDIPLFGDQSIIKHHACIQISGHDVIVQGINGAGVTINGAPITSARLNHGDTIGIGRHNLRFHQKVGQYVQQMTVQQQVNHQRWFEPATQVPQAPSVSTQTRFLTATPATGTLALTIMGGPHMAEQFTFAPGTIRIGRDSGCGILLAQDTMISRTHAEITWDGTKWTLRDLGSTNGVWVQGSRVSEHVLNPGDQFGIGKSIFRVDSV
ncbi:MAG: FHA domain-containing protein [Armatimonadota bacterium]|nr:FHA domain-containing protein [bacterium]